MRSFLSLLDFTTQELVGIVDRATELKVMLKAGEVHQPLQGKTLAMIFELSSTRTRVAFETGMFQLGGHAIFIDSQSSQLGRGEPIEDSARVLSGMVDIVSIRTINHQLLEKFANVASIPLINAMSNTLHPCQLLADMQTFQEHRGSIEGKQVAFIGDGYNMCNSYINAAQQFNFNLRIACPIGFQPDAARLQKNTQVQLVTAPEEAVKNADLVVTDVWSSMGHEEEQTRRINAFKGYQVTTQLLDLANKDVLFMHCLPAHRGEEISQDLLDDKRSVAWEEAGNRLHSQKALLEFLL
ncbi:MAG: ornithine carbamoyltransferase [Pseudomonadales bacterium]|nr:ornithine carbamoyltransferase [Pseudomonadales bacterium]